MKAMWIVAGLVLSAQAAVAQSPADDALNVVRRLFDAMRNQDTTAIRATLHSSARLIVTGTNPQGQPMHQPVTMDRFVASIGGAPNRLDERIHDPEVRVDENLATVWTRYDFYVGENFSHCGYDSFQLARLGGAWKIVQIADTQRRNNEARCGRGTAPVAEVAPTAADSAAVVTALQRLFDGMASRDTAAIRASLAPSGQLIGLNAESTDARPLDASQFVAIMGRQQTPMHERMVNPEIRIHDNLATVWTWYTFHRGEEFSHCGIDAAQLVRTTDGWRIVQITYTARPMPCDRPTRAP